MEGAGYTIHGIYADPLPALEAGEKVGTPDIIILDERLGTKSGTEQIARFRDTFPGARIVLISADPDAVQAAEDFGFDEGKCKPVTMRRLLENFEGLLRRPCRTL